MHGLAAVQLPALLAFLQLAGAEAPAVRTEPERLVNGVAFLLHVTPASRWRALHATFDGRPVAMERATSGSWTGLAGVDYGAESGDRTLVLQAVSEAGAPATYQIAIPVERAERPSSELSVARRFVEPNARARARIERERVIKARLLNAETPERLFHGSFVRPVAFDPVEEFGVERVFNGKRQSVHLGLDYRAPPGTPVHAANAGRVMLVRDLYYEGRTVAVDHGRGLVTLYLHLSRAIVKEGQRVKRGQRLGLSGASGRVTGPHLHLAVRWRAIYLDPESLLELDLGPRSAAAPLPESGGERRVPALSSR